MMREAVIAATPAVTAAPVKQLSEETLHALYSLR
jgi:hypothetical protein